MSLKLTTTVQPVVQNFPSPAANYWRLCVCAVDISSSSIAVLEGRGSGGEERVGREQNIMPSMSAFSTSYCLV